MLRSGEKMNDKPNYYAIIPANVRYDNNIKASSKLMYGEIVALSNKCGYCTATNSYFAKLYGVSNRSVSGWINELVEQGYIKSEMIKDEETLEIQERRLYLDIISPSEDKFYTPIEANGKTAIEENFQENNTRLYNTTSFNNIYSQAQLDDGHLETIKEIINYLNEKADKNYKNSAYAKKHIKARLNEGYALDDFKKVIDNKVADWKGDSNFDKFLRPQTLFSNKFESYLNESPVIDQSKEDIYEYTKDLGW